MTGYLSAKVQAFYPGSDDTGLFVMPKYVEIHEEVNRHTYMTVEHLGNPQHFTASMVTGAPAQVATSSRFGERSWFGYITDVVPTVSSTAGSTDNVTKVTILGLTYYSKNTSKVVWKHGTIARYCSDIIYGQGLIPYVEEKNLYQTVPQAGRSNWQVLTDMARDSGLDVFTTGTTVNCLSPKGALSTFLEEAPRLQRLTGADAANIAESVDTIVYSDNHARAKMVQAMSVDPFAAKPVTYSGGEGIFVDYLPGTVGQTPTALGTKALSQARICDLPVSATVTMPGNVLVNAGKPVYLTDEGISEWWLVESAVHSFTPPTGVYETRAVLRRASWMDQWEAPPLSPRKNTRSQSRFCMCREQEPLLVNQARATYIDAPLDGRVGIPENHIYGPPLPTDGLAPWHSRSSLARWRGRGKCGWV